MQPANSDRPQALWIAPVAILCATGLAFALYVWTAAPGITWAHHGADSGELLAAAMVNGVPHPPGYPLYMLALQAWLMITAALAPGADLAWRGNLFSALAAALSVGVTVAVVAHLLRDHWGRWVWAVLAALAWAFSPLLWSQAIITEVYALHALAIALLGWAVLVKQGKTRWLIPIVALGVAHHLTYLLLLPAVLYYLGSDAGKSVAVRLRAIGLGIGLGGLIGLLFYLRTPLVAGTAGAPPPVNWGYPDNWRGFLWLVSGSAYRGYLFSLQPGEILGRVGEWAYTLTSQYTPVGLGLALVGLSYLDTHRPRLRNFGLLWVLPISLYAISYFTRDSEIYLLPVSWMMALWIGVGAATSATWLANRWPRLWRNRLLICLAGVGLIALLMLHWSDVSLRQDNEAEQYLVDALAMIEPGAVIITNTDKTTFAMWYSAWGDQQLQAIAPDVIVLNHALYQFDWYRRLQGDLYPQTPGVDESVRALLDANEGQRAIYFTEEIPEFTGQRARKVGPLWRYE